MVRSNRPTRRFTNSRHAGRTRHLLTTEIAIELAHGDIDPAGEIRFDIPDLAVGRDLSGQETVEGFTHGISGVRTVHPEAHTASTGDTRRYRPKRSICPDLLSLRPKKPTVLN